MNHKYYRLVLKLQKVKYGRNLTLLGMPAIINKGSMKLGDRVVVKSSFWSNLVGLYQKTIICTRIPEAEINIGNDVGISGITIYARQEITIGDGTCIGGNTKILDNDFHPLDVEERSQDIKEKIGTKPIHIGKNCFIGCNCLILKGTELGDGCVVGAGAVVTGKFEANSVIVGNPARAIRNLKE